MSLEVSYTKTMTLLSECDGRDKVNKFLSGAFKVIAAIAEKNGNPNARNYKAVVSLVGNTRSMMNMGKFFAEFQKLNELIQIIIALSPKYAGTKKFVEILRIVFNILFIICDNLALMANFNLLAVNRVAMSTQAKKCQTLGYLFAAVVDLFNLKDAIWRLNYDPPAAKCAICSSALLFVQDSTDAFTNMLFLGYLNFIFAPTDVSIGNLTCIAAMMGLVSHWRKMK